MKERKAGIIGMGAVGASVAMSILNTGVVNNVLINDLNHGLAEGEAMDLSHGSSFYPKARIKAAEIDEMLSCDIIVVAAGRGGKPEETRLQLLKENAKIISEIAKKLTSYEGIVLIVSNPVDVLTHIFKEASGLPEEKILGTGTMLDTARLRDMIAQEINVHPKSVHAQVIGEHGDSEVVLWSTAQIGSTRLHDWKGWDKNKEPEISEKVKKAAQEIIKRKGATNHAIGLVAAHIVKWILRDERRIICLSRYHEKYKTAISLPAIVGIDGATEVIFPEMSNEEGKKFGNSAQVLRDAYSSIKS